MILDTRPGGWWTIADQSLADQGILDKSPGGQGGSRNTWRVGCAITDKRLTEQGI